MSLDISRDPFRDPATTIEDRVGTEESTLVVGREASLTLGTDSLIVLDESMPPEKLSRLQYCNPLRAHSTNSPVTKSIPFYNILWASLNEYDVTINYSKPLSTSVVRSTCIAYPIIKSDRSRTARWVERLLDKAYGPSQRAKRIKLLINPFGGSGNAQKWFTRDIEPLFAAARCEVDVERTQYSGHAVEIAEKLDISRYDVIASCSGDGLPHEVFNGLGLRPDAGTALASVAVVQLPCGTGNAMSLNLNGTTSPSMAALAVIKGLRTPLDLVSVSQGERRTLSFLTQAFGIVAETDLGTEHLRWMGDFRLTYGFLVRLLGKTTYPCDIALKLAEDTKPAIRERCRQYRQADIRTRAADSPHTIATASTAPMHSTTDDLLPSQPSDIPQSFHNDTSETSQNTGLPALKDGNTLSPLPTTATRTATWGPLIPHPTIGNFYAGNMPWVARDMNFFPAALPADGCIDLVCIDGTIPRWAAFMCLIGIGNGKLFEMPEVEYRKVEGYRIVPRPVGEASKAEARKGWGPGHGWGIGLGGVRSLLGMESKTATKGKRKGKKEGFIAIDGESVPFEAFQVEVHRGLGTVLSRSGKMYEAPFLE